jgi:hypothetical protein
MPLLPRSRRGTWLLAAAVWLAACLVSVKFLPARTPSLRTFRDVKVGMSIEEINRLVGGPPGIYPSEFLPLPDLDGEPQERWTASDAELIVYLADNHTACHVVIFEHQQALPTTFWRRVRSWFGL